MSAERRQWYVANNVAVLGWECLAKGFLCNRFGTGEDLARMQGADISASSTGGGGGASYGAGYDRRGSSLLNTTGGGSRHTEIAAAITSTPTDATATATGVSSCGVWARCRGRRGAR